MLRIFTAVVALGLLGHVNAYRRTRFVFQRRENALRVWHEAASNSDKQLEEATRAWLGKTAATLVLSAGLLALSVGVVPPQPAFAAGGGVIEAAAASATTASKTASSRRTRLRKKKASEPPVKVTGATAAAEPGTESAERASIGRPNGEKETSNKLTQMGLALVAINIVALLFSGDDAPPPPSRRKTAAAVKRKSAPSAPTPPPSPARRVPAPAPAVAKKVDDDDDLFDIPVTEKEKAQPKREEKKSLPRIPRSTTSGSVSSRLASSLPSADDLFDGEDVDKAMDAAENAPAEAIRAATNLIPQEMRTPPPPPAPAPAPAPKKNLLDRIFSKPGGGRPTEMNTALRSPDDPSHDYRVLVASALSSYVPASSGGVFSGTVRSEDADGGSAALLQSREECGLTEQDAANAFAEVANAMLVTVIDRAVGTLAKSKGSDEENKATLDALEDVADFIGGAGSIFVQTVPGAVIEPVVYNGKAKKGDLENLYLAYMRESMSLDSILSVAGLAGQQGKDQEQGQDVEEAAKKAQDSAADKLERLGKLQVVFNIKEAKRSSLEQKAMREMFMNMAKGEGGGGGLGDLKGMFDALQGGGSGDGKMPDMDALNAMLGGGAGGGAGGGMPGGMPDIGNMDPAEVQAMSNDAISAVRSSLFLVPSLFR
jgi:hypothetical protein